MIISVASGKGGTGKTLVATNLALSLDGKNVVQVLDCDVEEPDAHIFIRPTFNQSKPVFIPIPQVDKNKCTYCGECAEVCVYNAIAVIKKKVLVFPELCHGCGACSYLCPEGAIIRDDANKQLSFDYVDCKGCGICAKECPTKAIEMAETESEEGK